MFCSAYGALWFVYGVIAKSSPGFERRHGRDGRVDARAGARLPEAPAAARVDLLGLVQGFPLADWAYILLAVVTVAVGIYLAIELAAEWLAQKSWRRCRFCSRSIPFYNFLGLKFDQNSILIPLWALAMWAMLRALDTRHDGWAALAGLAAAAAMLSKYWSVFLIAALSLAAVRMPNGAIISARGAVGDGARFSRRSRAACLVADPREFSADHLGDVAARLGFVR